MFLSFRVQLNDPEISLNAQMRWTLTSEWNLAEKTCDNHVIIQLWARPGLSVHSRAVRGRLFVNAHVSIRLFWSSPPRRRLALRNKAVSLSLCLSLSAPECFLNNITSIIAHRRGALKARAAVNRLLARDTHTHAYHTVHRAVVSVWDWKKHSVYCLLYYIGSYITGFSFETLCRSSY